MRIVVDLQGCQNGGRGRGIGRYAMALTRALALSGRGHEVRVVVNGAFPGSIGQIRRELEGAVRQTDVLVMELPGRTASAEPANAWRTRAAELERARFLDTLGPDLVFVPSLFDGYHDPTVVSIEPSGAPTAVTIYDFIPMDHPEVYLPSEGIRGAYLRKLRDARRADLLLPISDYVAAQTVARLGVEASRVVSVPLGVEPHFRPVELKPATRAALMRRYGVTRPFVLNTSPLEFRKNLEGLIAGFGRMSPAARARRQLVVVGRMDPGQRKALAETARSAGLAGDALVLAGFVPDDDLVALYSACELFVFPSISEGFGLPVLEAMACGAPVIGSGLTSIPEVIGREELLFDPRDAHALGRKMEAVLADAPLREELRSYGLARAAPYTWDRTAANTLDAFERLARARTRPAPASSIATGRPALALIPDRRREAAGLSPRSRRLLDALAVHYDVTLVAPALDGAEAAWERAVVERIDTADLTQAAPRFDRLVHVVSDPPDGARLRQMAMHPGVHVWTGPDAPASAEPELDVYAALGLGGLLDLAQGGLDEVKLAACRGAAARAASGDAVVRACDLGPAGAALGAPHRIDEGAEGSLPGPASALALAGPLRNALERAHAGPSRDAARALAAVLPRAVRGIEPDAEDLARLAAAVVRNEAHDRSPATWLDISGLEDGRATRAQGDLLRRLLRVGGRDLRCMTFRGGGFWTAEPAAARLFGLTTLDPLDVEEEAVFRPGDRLLGIGVLDGLPPRTHRALVEAEEAGAGIAFVLMSMTALSVDGVAERILTWSRDDPVAPVPRMQSQRVDGGEPSSDVAGERSVLAALEAGLPASVLLLGAGEAVEKRLRAAAPALAQPRPTPK